jgi:hypothetical protein
VPVATRPRWAKEERAVATICKRKAVPINGCFHARIREQTCGALLGHGAERGKLFGPKPLELRRLTFEFSVQ